MRIAAIALCAAIFFTVCDTQVDAASSSSNAPIFSDESDGANWPSVGRTHNETYYSPLTQISDENIQRLKLAWYIDLPTMISALSTPLAVDGVLYFAVGHSIVYAADAATGHVRWTYDPEVMQATSDKVKQSWGIRGLAYADGRVFVGTEDGRLIALSAKDGSLIWSAQTFDKDDGRYITGAPRVFNGKVIIGHGGADGAMPVRAYVTAYDARTGEQVWRFFIVPGNPADGFEDKAMEMAAKTWTGEWWKYGGGGTAWNALVYDSKYNRVYIGTGNGQPWNQKIRSPGGGDNLFLCSIVALDADTGEYVWHYQTTPAETWDYNSVMDIELTTLTIKGQQRDVLLHAPKNGFFYVVDRADGKLISAEPISKITWATHVDLETGRPVETPEARFLQDETVLFPGGNGVHNWYAMSYNPITGLVYIPTDFGSGYYNKKGIDPQTWTAAVTPIGFIPFQGELSEPDNKPAGMLQAWDPVQQKRVWSVKSLSGTDGGVLSTAGNLVFQGKNSGPFQARDAKTGDLLWSFDAQVGIVGQPITYTVDGKQYVTVIAGYAGPPALHGPKAAQWGWRYRTQKRRVLTFALDGEVSLPAAEPVEPLKIGDDPAFEIDPMQLDKGTKLFPFNCVVCHGFNAIAAGNAPDLRASEITLSKELFDEIVRGGLYRPSGMPQFEKLTREDVEALRHYIRNQARKALQKQRSEAVR